VIREHGACVRTRALREWTAASRRALDVILDLELPVTVLPPVASQPLVTLRGVYANTCASSRSRMQSPLGSALSIASPSPSPNAPCVH
jgi:hypothetical protein